MSVSPITVQLGTYGVPFISGLQSPLPNFQNYRRQGQGGRVVEFWKVKLRGGELEQGLSGTKDHGGQTVKRQV